MHEITGHLLMRFAHAARGDKIGRPSFGQDCHLWAGSTTSGRAAVRYGIFFAYGKRWIAHRVAYAINAGFASLDDIPANIAHTCGNKLCVNPNHLMIASRKRRNPPTAQKIGTEIA